MADRYRRGRQRHEPYPKFKPKPEFPILTKVLAQNSFRRNLIFLQTSSVCDSSFTILQNAVNYIGGMVKVINKGAASPSHIEGNLTNMWTFSLLIDNELIASGKFSSEANAKKGLSQLAIEELKKTCFTIIRKIHPRSSPQVDFAPPSSQAGNSSVEQQQENAKPGGSNQLANTPLKGGIGEKMMKMMGWSGGGLGAQEQGRTEIVENYIQINRQGLGSKNIVQEVTQILQKHAASKSINSVAFSSDFTKEERGIIHQVARKLNLKSKSYGHADDRVLVIQSKIRLIDLVRTLLEVGGENEQYQLLLPTNFKSS